MELERFQFIISDNVTLILDLQLLSK